MKKITFLFTMLLMAGIVSAQTTRDGISTEPGRSATFMKNSFWDNWFIGAGAGANIYFGERDSKADIMDRVTVAPAFQFGTWFSPYYGMRIKGTGGFSNLHTFNNDAKLMSRNKYVSAEINFMWDVTNYLMNYNSKRVYSFIPYIGAGWAYGWDYKNQPAEFTGHFQRHSATVDGGLINRFRFSERLALDVEFSGKLLRNDFDQRVGKREYDLLGTVSGSLVYTFGPKATFDQAELKDPAEITRLNARINEQRAEIDALLKRPPVVKEPEIVVREVVKEVDTGMEPVNNVVLFSINKTKVESHQEVNVYNVAKYLRENPEAKLRIVGYTDRATGTVAINERLSRERAQNVADLITGKYGISSNRVKIQWEGQMNPPFDVVEWNRCVIMYLE